MNQPKGVIPNGEAPAQNLQARFYRYMRLFRRTWWVLVLTVGGVLCLQAVMIHREVPTYLSVSRMWVSGLS